MLFISELRESIYLGVKCNRFLNSALVSELKVFGQIVEWNLFEILLANCTMQ